MKKVFQTNIDKDNGNCMQAIIASLFEMDINDVPNFISFYNAKNTNPHFELLKFLRTKGYNYSIWTSSYLLHDGGLKLKHDLNLTKRILKIDGGINNYFYASVKSQTFDKVTHAVIIDNEMNIIHDPNPNQLALKLKAEDILDIITCSDNWYIDINGELIINKN